MEGRMEGTMEGRKASSAVAVPLARAWKASLYGHTAGRCRPSPNAECRELAEFDVFDVESAILNVGFLVGSASPRPSDDCRQEGQLCFIPGGGLGELLLLEIFMAEVGRIGGRHCHGGWMELVAEC